YGPSVQRSEKVRLVDPRQGECDDLLNGLLDEYEQQGVRFGPALAFLDQFGYSAVSMSLVERILRYPSCEVFLYLDYKDMNRWITDPAKAPSGVGTKWCNKFRAYARRTTSASVDWSRSTQRGGRRAGCTPARTAPRARSLPAGWPTTRGAGS